MVRFPLFTFSIKIENTNVFLKKLFLLYHKGLFSQAFHRLFIHSFKKNWTWVHLHLLKPIARFVFFPLQV